MVGCFQTFCCPKEEEDEELEEVDKEEELEEVEEEEELEEVEEEEDDCIR
jgi:hypothetical protein